MILTNPVLSCLSETIMKRYDDSEFHKLIINCEEVPHFLSAKGRMSEGEKISLCSFYKRVLFHAFVFLKTFFSNKKALNPLAFIPRENLSLVGLLVYLHATLDRFVLKAQVKADA